MPERRSGRCKFAIGWIMLPEGWAWLGDGAWRGPRPVAAPPGVLSQMLRRDPAVWDVLETEHAVAVYFDPQHPPTQIQELLQGATPDASHVPGQHRLRVCYDGPDLVAVAEALKLSVEELIHRHSHIPYQVAMLGFMPGFAYLRGADSSLSLPRRSDPRPRIAAGSLALGGPYTAIYPWDSPGGWHLLGRVLDTTLFDAQGALLQAGDWVRFEVVQG